MKHERTRPPAAVIFSFVVLALLATTARAQDDKCTGPNLAVVDRLENASEDVAEILGEMSVAVRDGDYDTVASLMTPDATVALATPASPKPEYRWVERKDWTTAATAGSAADPAVWRSFFSFFRDMSDARFKVKDATFPPPYDRGDVIVKFYLVGTNRSGQPEWLKGIANAKVERGRHGWKIRSFATDHVQSWVSSKRLFTDVTGSTGVARKIPPIWDPANFDPIFVYAHGAAAGDVDGDGLLDLAAATKSGVTIYRNDGNGRFTDLIDLPIEHASAPLLVDIDNDGDLDLFVSVNGKQRLYENRLVPDGKLAFVDISHQAGVDVDAVGFSAAAADVNGDGLPDIYVASYNRMDQGAAPNNYFYATNGTPNLLFLNLGGGRFREAAAEAGVADSHWSLSAEFADVDGDGAQDLVVCNDYSECVLYRNEMKDTGKLHFADVTDTAGLRNRHFGMGESFGDFNNDGILDLHVTGMSSTAGNRILDRYSGCDPSGAIGQMKSLAHGNDLYEGLGGGRFRNVTAEVGPFPAGWEWGGGFFDFDNDGWQDLHSAAGYLTGKQLTDT